MKELLLLSCILVALCSALPAQEKEETPQETPVQPLVVSSALAEGEEDLNTAEYRHRGYYGGGGWGRGYHGGYGRGWGGYGGGYGGGWGGYGYGRGWGGGYGKGWGYGRGYYW